MKFINNGPSRRIPLGESENRRRVGLDHGQIIDLPVDVGRKFGLDEVTEGRIGKTKVETKQFEKPKDVSFYNKLSSIKGIGYKTAKDIVEAFTEKELIKEIKLKQHLPFRDDVAKKLIRKYGK